MSELPLSNTDDGVGVGETTNAVLVDTLCAQQNYYNFNIINKTLLLKFCAKFTNG